MKRALSTLFASLFLTVPAWADSSSGHVGMNQAWMNHEAMSSAFSQGMVRKVDKAQGKPTPRHGPLTVTQIEVVQ